jgi:hypothetical protein
VAYYIYIYIERERERERESFGMHHQLINLSIYIIYTYMLLNICMQIVRFFDKHLHYSFCKCKKYIDDKSVSVKNLGKEL